jgi:hypothetical protein
MNLLLQRKGEIQRTFAGANKPKTIPVETQKESALRDGSHSGIIPVSENGIAFNRMRQKRGKMAVFISRTNI